MATRLAHSCGATWLLGFAGLWVARGFLDQGPGTVLFELCAQLWFVGGLGYAVLGCLCVRRCLRDEQRAGEQGRARTAPAHDGAGAV